MPTNSSKQAKEIIESDLFLVDTGKLGTPKIIGGRIEWTPPTELSQAEVAVISESIRQLNSAIERGDYSVRLNNEGKIQVISKGEEE